MVHTRPHGRRFTGTLLGAEIARSSRTPLLIEKGGPAPALRPSVFALLAGWWRVAAVVGLVALGLLALRR
jgi:hypothetical protein